ncbi:MAG: L-ribulose-5-phosphate 4-epimerase AraD [Lentisphaerae bacterium]|nr:L-ribulose-5-phosphate 4-epimerase AraD [Lentisphaerota bacterium]
MGYEALKQRVCEANKAISRAGLAILTWGNASEVDRAAGLFAIKPSGVDYDVLTPDDIVLVSVESGERVEGELSPSSDSATHAELYRCFAGVGGIVHTHSCAATAWAQARRGIPCLGTTHADHFYGEVPCTRALTREEVEGAYELNTGKVIVAHFEKHGLDAAQMPAVLVACHGPFVWGTNAAAAVTSGITLEEVARMAQLTFELAPEVGPVDDHLLDKHFLRKHGAEAYYGQRG